MLRTIGCRRGQASSSTGSKAKWSPEKAKDLLISYLLNKNTIEREKEEEKKEEKEKREARI